MLSDSLLQFLLTFPPMGGRLFDNRSELSKYVEEAEAMCISQKKNYLSIFSNRLVTVKLLQKCSK